MNQTLSIWLRFLRFYWKAKTKYDVHSPFVAEFVNKVLEDRRMFYVFPLTSSLRKLLKQDRRILEITDYGAGSKINRKKNRQVRDIARHSAIPPYVGKLLFKAVNFLGPHHLIELGTSLGISTIYLSAASLDARLISIEGCPATAQIALENFRRLNHQNIEVLVGPFKEQLPIALKTLGKLDFLYLDGDHREGASLQYIEQCLPYIHQSSVLVIADIYWSEEMQKAWENLIARSEVTLSIDLFFCGFLFFRPEIKEKQHFHLIEQRWKPWRIGL